MKSIDSSDLNRFVKDSQDLVKNLPAKHRILQEKLTLLTKDNTQRSNRNSQDDVLLEAKATNMANLFVEKIAERLVKV